MGTAINPAMLLDTRPGGLKVLSPQPATWKPDPELPNHQLMLLPCSIDLCLPDTYPRTMRVQFQVSTFRCVILDQSVGAEGCHFTTALIQGSDVNIKMLIATQDRGAPCQSR